MTCTSSGATGPNYMVTNTNDSGPGSLRQAICDLNRNTIERIISIDFSNSLGGTITLQSPLPTINAGANEIQINGPNNNTITIIAPSSQPISPIFTINAPNTPNYNLTGNNLTLSFSESNSQNIGISFENTDNLSSITIQFFTFIECGISLSTGSSEIPTNFCSTTISNNVYQNNQNQIFTFINNQFCKNNSTTITDNSITNGSIIDSYFNDTISNNTFINGGDITCNICYKSSEQGPQSLPLTITGNTLPTGSITVKGVPSFCVGGDCNISQITVTNNILGSSNNPGGSITINSCSSTTAPNKIANNTLNGGSLNLSCHIPGEHHVPPPPCPGGVPPSMCNQLVADNIFNSIIFTNRDAITLNNGNNVLFLNNQINSGYANGITLYKSLQTIVKDNTITNHKKAGITLISCKDCNISKNTIQGNKSSFEGIAALDSSTNNIKKNLIGGTAFGIHFRDADNENSRHMVEKNKLGFGPDGKPAPLRHSAIHFGKKSHTNIAKCNTIAHSGKGITADTPSAIHNTFTGNSISQNASKGIGLTNGANDDQAFPVLNFAQANGNTIIIKGTLTSLPNTTFRIEFFRNPVDRNPITEGKDPLGSVVVKTDVNGFVSFTARVLSTDTTGFVSSTATVLDGPNTGDTSEFSLNIPITAGGTPQSAIGLAIFKKYCASENPCAGT